MEGNQLRSWGLASLMMGLAIGAVGRALHTSEGVSIALSVLSGLFSIAAMVLFFKASPGGRRPFLVGVIVAIILALAISLFVLVRH